MCYLRTYFHKALILRKYRSSEIEDYIQEDDVRGMKKVAKDVGFLRYFLALLH